MQTGRVRVDLSGHGRHPLAEDLRGDDPLAAEPRHVAVGQLIWTGLRRDVRSRRLRRVMVGLRRDRVPHAAALLLPVAVLTGLAFAAPIQAFAATQRERQRVRRRSSASSSCRCSSSAARSSPSRSCPTLLQWSPYLTPLWHGVALARGIALDVVDPVLAAVNLAYPGGLRRRRAAWRRAGPSRRKLAE